MIAIPSRTRTTLRGETKNTKPRSPSIELLKRSLEGAGINRKTFVKETGLSYEYVSRIFNSKVKFPTVRETLERFAEVANIDPMRFSEYQQLIDALPESTRKLWNRMQEMGISRQDFANKVAISRTYMYEILRGDVPFPRNPEVIEKIAAALDTPPEAFEEYLAPVQDWAERNPVAIERIFFDLLVGKVLQFWGYAEDGPASQISDELLGIFPSKHAYDAQMLKVLEAMGKTGISATELAKETRISYPEIKSLLLGKKVPAPEVFQALKKTLKLH